MFTLYVVIIDCHYRLIIVKYDSYFALMTLTQWRRQVSEFGGAFEGQHAFWGGGQDRISRNLPSPSLPKFLTPWIFSIHFFPKVFPGHFEFFSRPFKIVPTYQNFSRTYQNVIFLATFHKFLQLRFFNNIFQPLCGVVPTAMALSD